jgi:hypothetical protein
MANEEAPSPDVDVDQLESLPTGELRERAFARAERHHDVGFFWDLLKHLPSSESFGSDDGSAGGLGESISGVIEFVQEVLGRHESSDDPLLRARYIDYLTTHSR